MIAQTSLLAYKEIFHRLSPMEQRVLAVIREHGEIDNQGIADALGLPVHHITGRTNSLADIKSYSGAKRPPLIEKVKEKQLNRFGHLATFWKVADNGEIIK